MTQNERRPIWETRVEAYRASGASGQRASEWCAAHQVTPRQLSYWMKKLKKVDEISIRFQWVSLHVDHAMKEEGRASLLVQVGSVAIEVGPGYNPSLLADVVRTLKTLC
ncbi:IS66 family insertion sequence element accessory protein TnpA [Thermicanus aegyptius]|uniref:IS66 family insertion sequence element accessory protein TnpA n=1 Tax=Thermicanus aegyptius TaxID=94009 RepID=UPI00041CE97B|nr:hypothetical protein [Thermicanus aegyptius]